MTRPRLCCIQSACEAERQRLRAAALESRLLRAEAALLEMEKRVAIRGKGTWPRHNDFTAEQAARLRDEGIMGGEPV